VDVNGAKVNGADDDYGGCPNRWIVDQGREQVQLEYLQPLWLPDPPNLVGFQTTNKVHLEEHVESTLFNLVYNTNAVWIELYESAVWRIAGTRGTGRNAAPISTRVTPPVGGDSACHYVDANGNPHNELCYAKNLAQWGEELHWRRTEAERLWANFQGLPYEPLKSPFPASYEYTFSNNVGARIELAYINPAKCVPERVIGRGSHGVLPSALGRIVID
jgi:hypothetical protein